MRSFTSAAILFLVVGCGGSRAPGGAKGPGPFAGQFAGPLAESSWAGDEMVLTVTQTGATAGFACATGTLSEPLFLDGVGHFEADGNYSGSSGGPDDGINPDPPPVAARYSGTVSGSTMEVLVVLTATGTTHGPYHLVLDGRDSLDYCL
jgi:hypothetical protein